MNELISEALAAKPAVHWLKLLQAAMLDEDIRGDVQDRVMNRLLFGHPAGPYAVTPWPPTQPGTPQ